MHTAIDAQTGTVKTGQLFASQGIRLAVGGNEQQRAGRFGFGISLDNTGNSDDPFGTCFLGGERRIAFVESSGSLFPSCPNWFDQAKYLRLVLISPGDFGAWAPSWLLPDSKAGETGWCTVPGSDINIRLCSAFVPRWQPVSGWDYETGSPKATRKLVPAGAVYVVEVENADRSQEFAQMVWGRSIGDNLSDPDGCGAVCVGNVTI
jgi:CRISPR-associated protein Cmr3